MPVQFSIEDVRTPEKLERLLRQFQTVLQEVSGKNTGQADANKLADQLAPMIRDRLQATGSTPLNLQSLLPLGNSAVLGPSSAVNNDVVVFDGTSGTLVKDSGLPYTNIVKGPASATADHLAVFDGATGKLIKDGGAVPSGTGGSFVPLTAPVFGDFAWINQGGATVDTTLGIFLTSATAGAATNDLHILKKAAPSTPYTITIGFVVMKPNSDFTACGVLFRESGTGRLATCAKRYATDNNYAVERYIDPTTFDSTTASRSYETTGPVVWLRITDDGADRISSVSMDGQNFYVLSTTPRTTFLTADEVGFFINPNNGEVGMTLLSWKET